MLQNATKLSNVQLELLKMFERNVPENDLLAIKRKLSDYFFHKAVNEADRIWEQKGWTNEDAEKMVKQHKRIKYR